MATFRNPGITLGSGMHIANSGTLNTATIGSLTQQALAKQMSNLTANLTINHNDLVFAESSAYYKKYEIYESKEDILSLSCAWYRLRKNRQEKDASQYANVSIQHLVSNRINNLLCRELFESTQPEDFELSEKIRDYYSKKIMMLTLKDKHLSAYRTDLKEFIHSDGKKFTEKTIPLVFRLPEFYHYDIEFDSVKSGMVHSIPEFARNKAHNGKQVFRPLKKLFRKNNKVKGNEYWMANGKDHMYLIQLEVNNPLLGLWEREFAKKEITLTGTMIPKVRDDLEYYLCEGYSVLEG